LPPDLTQTGRDDRPLLSSRCDEGQRIRGMSGLYSRLRCQQISITQMTDGCWPAGIIADTGALVVVVFFDTGEKLTGNWLPAFDDHTTLDMDRILCSQ